MNNRVFDPAAAKRAAKLSINSDLLAQARELGINLSQTLEASLEALIRERRAQRWPGQNRAAINAYNERGDKDGVFSDGLRRF